MRKMDTKKLAFSLMMGALGSAFFAVSYYFGPVAPGVNLDFSLIAVFIAGFFGGPIVGAFSGLIAGILPGVSVGSTTYFVYILPKALVELAIIGVVIAALIGNSGFCNFTGIFTKRECQRKTTTP